MAEVTLKTNLIGRLRNTKLPKTQPLLPLFEAIVNSIQSIDQRCQKDTSFQMEMSSIRIRILREDSLDLENDGEPPIVGFEIVDNGCGFTEENFKSFLTLDSAYKEKMGCHGVGRLLWLKEFNSISVSSCFSDGDSFF